MQTTNKTGTEGNQTRRSAYTFRGYLSCSPAVAQLQVPKGTQIHCEAIRILVQQHRARRAILN